MPINTAAPSAAIIGAVLLMTPATGQVVPSGTGAMAAASEIHWRKMGEDAEESKLRIAILWGDFTKGGAYGTLLDMHGGFQAPDHLHTGFYHAVLLSGVWRHTFRDGKVRDLPRGSYIFQPGREPHGDHCISKVSCIVAGVQIEPHDYIPTKPIADSLKAGPLAPSAGKMWGPTDMKWEKFGNRTEIAHLWGDPALGGYGFLVKLPAGYSTPHSIGKQSYHAVAISGTWKHVLASGRWKTLTSEGYVFQPAGEKHGDACIGKAPCIILRIQDEAPALSPDQVL